MRLVRTTRALLSVVAVLTGVVPSGAQVPDGSPFPIPTAAAPDKVAPAVAVDRASGEYVVVWARARGGAGSEIVGQRFGVDSSPDGAEYRVSAPVPGLRSLQLAAGGAGGWMAAWEGASGHLLATRRHLFATGPGRRDGAASTRTGRRTNPAVAADASGGFVLVWEDEAGRDGDGHGVFGRRFDAAGMSVGDEFVVTESTVGDQGTPSVAMDAAGNFVVTWLDAPGPGRVAAVVAQRFDAAANRLGTAFTVNESAAVARPRVALDGGGSFLVVSRGGDGRRLVGRRFDPSGAPLGPERVLDAQHGSSAALAGSAAGFVVVWLSEDAAEGFGQRIAPDGSLLGPPFSIDPIAERFVLAPAVDMDDAGAAVVAWGGGTVANGAAVPQAVFAQKFRSEGMAPEPPAESPIPLLPPVTNLEPPSTNDDFATRKVVPGARYVDVANNAAGAANEVGEPVPSCGPTLTNTVWYEFTPPADGPYVFTSFGSSFNTILAVYTGTFGALAEVGCSDDVPGSQQARLTLTLDDAVTYYVQLGGHSGGGGDFKFYVVSPSDTLVPAAPVIATSAVGAPSTPLPNAGRTNLLSPVVAWAPKPAVTPYSYVVQLSTASNFSSSVTSVPVLDPQRFWQVAPGLPEPALPAGQKYYWRVTARNFLGQSSAPSMGYSFTLDRVAPAPPALVAPALNGVVSVLRPRFSWAAVAGASQYRLRVASNFSCSTEVMAGQVAATTFTPPIDLPQGEYWFCVQAADAAGNWGSFGEKRRFVSNLSLTPAQGAILVPKASSSTANVVFTWTRVPGATYEVEVASDSSFSVVVTSPPLATNTYTLPGQPFGTYYWRVRTPGNNLPMSLARHFTITPALPVAPKIQSAGALPGAVKSAGITNDRTPVFDWTVPVNWVTPPVGQSITYELQLATDIAFSALVAPAVQGLAATDYEWPTDLPLTAGTTYYWRVRAVTNLSLPGAYSVPYRFKLDTTDPGLPTSLTAPADTAVSSLARPVFSWAPGTNGASRYRFEIDDDPSFTAPPVYTATVGTLNHTPTGSLPQAVYHWHVYAQDAAGNETDLPTVSRTLTIDYRTAPIAGKVFTTANPAGVPVVFTWKVPTGAPAGTTYTIEIDEDLDGSPETALGPVTAASVTSSTLLPGDYQYRLVVGNGFGTSGFRAFLISLP